MKDFNGNDLKVGDTIFFSTGKFGGVLGKISELKGKSTIHVSGNGILKLGKRTKPIGEFSSHVINSEDVIKIQDEQ